MKEKLNNKKMSYLLTNISNLVTCKNKSVFPKKGKTQSDIGLIKNGFLHYNEHNILFAGNEKEYRTYKIKIDKKDLIEIDCKGKTVMPGFIDSHTHFVFSGSRSDEYEKRISGSTYEQIAAKGGGIRSTVNSVRKASKKELLNNAKNHLFNFIQYGTTTIECKSGYGLDFKNEIKLLEVINEINDKNDFGLDIFPTFLGAHSVPKGMDKKKYIDIIKYEMIPYVAKNGLAKFIDVFCELNYFTAAETEDIITVGANFGLIPKIHTDQFNSIGGIDSAIRRNALSVDHLEVLKKKDIRKLSGGNIIATALPGVSYFLDIPYTPVRELISNDVPVALATDFNPGSCMTENMQMIISLASIKLKMSAEEIINAVTINAAHSIFFHKTAGSLEPCKQADLIIFDFTNYKDLTYHFAVNQIEAVFKKGELIYN